MFDSINGIQVSHFQTLDCLHKGREEIDVKIHLPGISFEVSSKTVSIVSEKWRDSLIMHLHLYNI